MKRYLIILLLPVVSLFFSACSDDDELSSTSVVREATTEENDFDRWLTRNYVEPYNILFKYRFEDIESSMDYYLTKALKENVPIEHPVYSFVEHDRMPETVLVKPSKVIIVDGILIFENKELRDLMDIKVYVDTDADIRLARRILRDVCERGRTMQSVISQYTTTVKPMHEEFVEPSKKYADVIIPEGGFNSVPVAMLIQSIRSLIDNGE